jgi:hypothetical protein
MYRILASLLIFISLSATGCATQKESYTARTGTEQLLCSSAIDKALNNFEYSQMAGKDVYLEAKYLTCVDKDYVVEALKHRLMVHGAKMLDKADKADVIVEVASGAVGTDVQELFVGISEIPLPPPSPVAIPKIAFFTRNKLNGTAKLLVIAYDAKTKQLLNPSGMSMARSDQKNINVLGLGPVQYGSLPREVAAACQEKDASMTTVGNYITNAYESSPGPYYSQNPAPSAGVVPAGHVNYPGQP